jgi:hypothetical protein
MAHRVPSVGADMTLSPWPADPRPFNIGAYARLLGLPIDACPNEWSYHDRMSWREGWHWQDRQPDVGPVLWERARA